MTKELEQASGTGSAVTDGRKIVFLAILMALLVLGSGLRLHHLGFQNLWLDEAISFHLAAGAGWPDDTIVSNTPPLYFSLLRVSLAQTGVSNVAMRLLSALFGILCIPALMVWVRRMFDARTAIYAGLWLTLLPIHIYYSQEARTYTLLVLLLTLSYGCLWRGVSLDRRRDWALFSLFALLALYSHNLAILSLLAAAGMPWLLGTRAQCKSYALSLGLAVLGFLPWVLFSSRVRGHLPAADWQLWVWERLPPPMAIPRSLEVLVMGAHSGLVPMQFKQMTVLDWPPLARWLGIGLALLFAISALPVRGAERRPQVRRRLAIWVLLAFPLAALFGLSFIQPFYLPGRYDMVALPAVPILLGLGLSRLSRLGHAVRVGAVAAALLLCFLMGAKLHRYYSQLPVRSDYKQTAIALAGRAQADDTVVFLGRRAFPVLYELRLLGFEWTGRHCVHETKGVSLQCRHVRPSTEPPEAQVRDVLRSTPSEGAIFVALDNYTYSEDRLTAQPEDAPLLDALRREGYEVEATVSSLGILRFVRVQ